MAGGSDMKRRIKAHPTTYNGVRFRSRLEAQWAAFFDLIEWQWEYEPIDFVGWTPDFWLSFPCHHSECPETHELYAEVKPYRDLADFDGHPATKLDPHESPHPACFGLNPAVTRWEMSHGAGGGIYSLADWVTEADLTWKTAADSVRWCPEPVSLSGRRCKKTNLWLSK